VCCDVAHLAALFQAGNLSLGNSNSPAPVLNELFDLISLVYHLQVDLGLGHSLTEAVSVQVMGTTLSHVT